MAWSPPPPEKCPTCGRPGLRRCWQGEIEYDDGASSVCPNWNKKLDEIGGMTPEEADEAARFDSLFR